MNLNNKSDRELADLQTAILREQAVRRKLDASPEKIERAIAEYQEATGKGAGEEWEQPTGPLGAYRVGAVVAHDGEEWVSTHGNNVHSPGQSGWRLKAELDDGGNEIPPPYVAPSGAHDAYQHGEKITWTDGEVYAAKRDGVVHSPAEYPADWAHIIPATPIEPIEPDPEPEPIEPPEDDEEDPEPVDPEPEPEEDLPDFTAGEQVEPGDLRRYQGVIYQVLQAHTTADHWPPDAAHSLWTRA